MASVAIKLFGLLALVQQAKALTLTANSTGNCKVKGGRWAPKGQCCPVTAEATLVNGNDDSMFNEEKYAYCELLLASAPLGIKWKALPVTVSFEPRFFGYLKKIVRVLETRDIPVHCPQPSKDGGYYGGEGIQQFKKVWLVRGEIGKSAKDELQGTYAKAFGGPSGIFDLVNKAPDLVSAGDALLEATGSVGKKIGGKVVGYVDGKIKKKVGLAQKHSIRLTLNDPTHKYAGPTVEMDCTRNGLVVWKSPRDGEGTMIVTTAVVAKIIKALLLTGKKGIIEKLKSGKSLTVAVAEHLDEA